jgi:hypothetical protein
MSSEMIAALVGIILFIGGGVFLEIHSRRQGKAEKNRER